MEVFFNPHHTEGLPTFVILLPLFPHCGGAECLLVHPVGVVVAPPALLAPPLVVVVLSPLIVVVLVPPATSVILRPSSSVLLVQPQLLLQTCRQFQ